MIRLLLVDDDPAVLWGLRTRLGLEPDMAVLGESEDGEAALTMAARLAPDVVVLDARMPRLDGFAVAALLRAQLPGTAVVMLSMYDSPDARISAFAGGVAGFVGKHEPADMLIAAIRAAAR
ncbi:MAG: response regulator transcription factor [Dehalococcoidia bacterium]|nr:response regulator transcription factor [Dehalococcoidia bacterium]